MGKAPSARGPSASVKCKSSLGAGFRNCNWPGWPKGASDSATGTERELYPVKTPPEKETKTTVTHAAVGYLGRRSLDAFAGTVYFCTHVSLLSSFEWDGKPRTFGIASLGSAMTTQTQKRLEHVWQTQCKPTWKTGHMQDHWFRTSSN